jgi:transcription antitermination factor NusG
VCYWAAIRTPPQREFVVAGRLEDQLGCAIYLPRARLRLARSLRPATVPLFATYVFADIDLGPPWQAIKRQPGVIGMVMTGDTPSRCPSAEIEKLKASEGPDGFVRLAGQPPPESDQTFEEGQAVRIRLGAFDNRPARYARKGRKNMSVVMVVLLNRVVAVQVPTCALAAESA